MSFMRAALRLAAVFAIEEGTDYQVCDSDIAPIDEKVLNETHPVISVYTDDFTSDRDGKEYLGVDEQKLIVQVGITKKTKVPTIDPVSQERAEKEVWMIAPTDSFMEITLDLMCRQVMLALTNAENQWSEMFRELHDKIIKVDSLRGASEGGDDRFAGRQIIFEIKMKREPALNPAIDAVCVRFLDLLEQNTEYAKVAGLMRDTLNGTSGDMVTEIRRSYGLTQREGEHLMLDIDVAPTA